MSDDPKPYRIMDDRAALAERKLAALIAAVAIVRDGAPDSHTRAELSAALKEARK